MTRVTVWSENVHDQKDSAVKAIYPEGMHACLAQGLAEDRGIITRTAVLQDPEHGLPEETLEQTDVLVWWGHMAHAEVSDTVVDRIQRHVWEGMGLIALHSAHFSKIFTRLLGTRCSLIYREAGERELLWVCNPSHPITQGLPPCFELPHEEMYGEPFAIPEPESLLFISSFEGGEVFRSGCTWTRGAGRIFYFRPGHETYPTYYDPNIKQVLKNAVHWASNATTRWPTRLENIPIDKAPRKIDLHSTANHG